MVTVFESEASYHPMISNAAKIGLWSLPLNTYIQIQSPPLCSSMSLSSKQPHLPWGAVRTEYANTWKALNILPSAQ